MGEAPGPIAVLRAHLSDVNAIVFHPLENGLLSGDAEGEVKFWDLVSRRPTSSARLHEAGAGIIGLTMSSVSGNIFLSQGRDGAVKSWELRGGIIAREPSLVIRTDSYHFCRLSTLQRLTESPATVDTRKESSREQEQEAFHQECQEGSASPGNGGSSADVQTTSSSLDFVHSETVGYAGRAAALPESEGPGTASAPAKEPHLSLVRKGREEDIGRNRGDLSAALKAVSIQGLPSRAATQGPVATGSSSAPPMVAIAGQDPSTIEIWDTQRGEQLQQLRLPGSSNAFPPMDDPSKLNTGMCMALQLFLAPAPAGGLYILAGYEDGTVALWDLSRPEQPLTSVRLHSEPVLSIAVDSTGTGGVSGAADSLLVFFHLDLALGQIHVKKEVTLKKPGVADIAIRGDNRIVAVAGWDHRVRIFDYKRRRPLAILRYHSAAVTAVCFSRNGRLLASSSRDSSIALWSVYPPGGRA